jgi:DNA-binding response OmpR family regulator
MANNKKTILIVEDDTMISAMYQTKLSAEGLEVLVADNGADGLKLAAENKPDLILLDVIMPQMDGFAVLTELKENAKTKKIPVVLLTNLSTEEDQQKGKQLGAAEYIVKSSLTPDQVSDKVKKLLQ